SRWCASRCFPCPRSGANASRSPPASSASRRPNRWKRSLDLLLADIEPGNEKLFEEARRILEPPLAGLPLPEHRTHLHVEVGIVLRGGPDGEDEVIGIAFGDLAGLRPAADDLRLLVDQRLQRPLQLVLDIGRALQDLV